MFGPKDQSKLETFYRESYSFFSVATNRIIGIAVAYIIDRIKTLSHGIVRFSGKIYTIRLYITSGPKKKYKEINVAIIAFFLWLFGP